MNPTMEFTQGEPLTEEQAIAHVESLGYHSLAFDDSHDVDEELHWHEFDSVAIVISGSGSFADETGAVTQVQPGCMVTAWGFKSPLRHQFLLRPAGETGLNYPMRSRFTSMPASSRSQVSAVTPSLFSRCF